MNVTYRDVDLGAAADRALLARWYNDPAIKHLFHRFVDAESFATTISPEHFELTEEPPPSGGPCGSLMVMVDEVPVGQATFEIDTPKLVCKLPHTAWISVVVGEEPLRGRGLGTRIVAHLEALVAQSGAERIEVGVFAYNTRSLGLFTRLGYEEFTRLPERAWFDGRRWDEVRLRKSL
ncbi:MAG: GNAT family N-acetyltransferase [Myxococcota bacterium]|jgi:RimJ/RimL family protein N-acetyltransferase|nr:GNAT family N-acetyltransferase [Myxococcota bacterium]